MWPPAVGPSGLGWKSDSGGVRAGGSRAMAGIGCHFMATWMDRETIGFTQMGGEGVPWVGQAPFTNERHIFANLGDGTYFHSGILAVRQSVAAGVNITYKILYNDAVAMTGGQPIGERAEGHSVIQIAQSMRAEGAKRIVIVTDEPEKYDPVGQNGVPGTLLGLPEGVRDVVGRRLSLLPDEANELLTVASVVGREFDLSVVLAAGKLDRGAVLDALDAVVPRLSPELGVPVFV